MTSVSRAAAMRGASVVTGVNVLVASGFSLAGLVSPQSILPAADDAQSRLADLRPLRGGPHDSPRAVCLCGDLSAIGEGSLVLGALAGVVQLLDAGVGVFQGDVGKTIGPLVIAALQFVAVFFLARTIDAGARNEARTLATAPAALTSPPRIAKKRASKRGCSSMVEQQPSKLNSCFFAALHGISFS